MDKEAEYLLPKSKDHRYWLGVKVEDYQFRLEKKEEVFRTGALKAKKRNPQYVGPEKIDEFIDDDYCYLLFAKRLLELLFQDGSIDYDNVINLTLHPRHQAPVNKRTREIIAEQAFENIGSYTESIQAVKGSISPQRLDRVVEMFESKVSKQRGNI